MKKVPPSLSKYSSRKSFSRKSSENGGTPKASSIKSGGQSSAKKFSMKSPKSIKSSSFIGDRETFKVRSKKISQKNQVVLVKDEELFKYQILFKHKINTENLDGLRLELIKSGMQQKVR